MKALSICEKLMKAIVSKKITKGRVHSVFNNACNIETEHEFVTLLSRGKGMVPMGVLVDGREQVDFKKLNITQNMTFNFCVNGISSNEENIFISLEDAQLWFPGVMEIFPDCPEEEVLKNIKAVEMGLNTYGRLYGISPLVGLLDKEMPDIELSALHVFSPDKSFEFIGQRFINFMKTLAKGDIEGITEAAEGVIGFGPGLTPAMDDFICGIMISFIYLGYYYRLDISRIYEFNRRLISGGLSKTTRVSSEMLRHSAAGEANQAVRTLIQAIVNHHNEKNIIKALLSTIDLGETSGSDMALGIYTGCKIMTNPKYRGEWLNETMCACKKGQLL